ncbi:MAG: hypothetical protein K2Q01_08565, partial [Rickettsiales bacterium]|nr:hypothetical protein [Rickettsiales bacterium]
MTRHPRTEQNATFLERRTQKGEDHNHSVTLLSGDYYVTEKPGTMIVTILGSCVAACMRDPVLGIGGMNHFLLPESSDMNIRHGTEATRYGAYAMEQLINGII